MNTTQLLDIYTSVLGWILYDGIWAALSDAGVVYIPFFLVIARNVGRLWGNAGVAGVVASLRQLELTIFAMFTVAVLAGAPALALRFGDLRFTAPCSGTTVTGGSTNSTYDDSFAAIGGQTGVVPVWWYLVMAVSNGVTNAAVAAVPCQADLRVVAARVENSSVKDPELRRQMQLFVQDCWIPSRAQFFVNHDSVPAEYPPDDIDWPGSRYFLDTEGYYTHSNLNLARRASEQIPGFPYDAARDSEYPSPTDWGQPQCGEWWTNETSGIRRRLIDQIDAIPRESMVTVVTSLEDVTVEEVYDAQIRKLFLSDGSLSQPIVRDTGAVQPQAGFLTKTISGLGLYTEALKLQATLYALRQAAPMGQSLILMAIYLMIPFVLVLSGFSLESVLTASIAIFALKFLTALWAVATWLDTTMIQSLEIPWWKQFFDESATVNNRIADMLTGLMFVGLPLIWFTVLGWAGISALSGVGKASEQLTQSVGSAAGNAANTATSLATQRGFGAAGKVANDIGNVIGDRLEKAVSRLTKK